MLMNDCVWLQGNHIFTSGATGTNAAVIKGALRANCPDKLTVILPQSLSKQPYESQELLQQVGGLTRASKEVTLVHHWNPSSLPPCTRTLLRHGIKLSPLDNSRRRHPAVHWAGIHMCYVAVALDVHALPQPAGRPRHAMACLSCTLARRCTTWWRCRRTTSCRSATQAGEAGRGAPDARPTRACVWVWAGQGCTVAVAAPATRARPSIPAYHAMPCHMPLTRSWQACAAHGHVPQPLPALTLRGPLASHCHAHTCVPSACSGVCLFLGACARRMCLPYCAPPAPPFRHARAESATRRSSRTCSKSSALPSMTAACCWRRARRLRSSSASSRSSTWTD